MVKCDWCKSPEHIELLTKLCERDTETQRVQKLIAEFFDVYPRILGLAYESANVLRMEKNLKVQRIAIDRVAAEIKRRADTDSPNYSISRRRVTEDQVRGILKEQRILIEGASLQREKLEKEKEAKDKEVLYTCPLCHGLITVALSKRDKIVSLRTTAEADDAYAYLAKQFDVSRSFLLSELIAIEAKFPSLFL
jgi:hypothetical protein